MGNYKHSFCKTRLHAYVNRRMQSDGLACQRQFSFSTRRSVILAFLVSATNGYSANGFSNWSFKCHYDHLSRLNSQKGRRLFSSIKSELRDDIRHAYEESETDGILRLASSKYSSGISVDDIITASWEASGEKSGSMASILNAWVGSCCLLTDRKAATALVEELMDAYKDLEEAKKVAPDIVTFSLAFTAFRRDPEADDLAMAVIAEAVRRSKKISGSKRRKIVAASRRRQSSSCLQVEQDLKALCGQDFSVIYETNDFVVINKPSGVPCFHKKTTTAGKIKKGKRNGKQDNPESDVSLVDALVNLNVPLSTLNPETMGLVHRLDRGSSGCLVLAKTDEMHALLLAEFFLRRTQKIYTTLVAPSPELKLSEEGTIDLPVDGRPAKSHYQIVERFGDRAAQLEFDIQTGRKHQIRVHAAKALSAPVVGDSMYSHESESYETKRLPSSSKEKFFLHASTLRIPAYGIDCHANIPSWWGDTISSLREESKD